MILCAPVQCGLMDSLYHKMSCGLAALVNQNYKVDLLQACAGNTKEVGQ